MKEFRRASALLACWISIVLECIALPVRLVSHLLRAYATGVANELEGE